MTDRQYDRDPDDKRALDEIVERQYLRLRELAAKIRRAVMIFPPATFVARAQNPQPPYALFEYSTLTGAGNTITATRVPVISPSQTTYWDLILQLNVDSMGNLTLAPLSAAKSPILITGNFMAGKYSGPSAILGGKAIVNVSGPGVASGGATVWSLASASGADVCTYPSTATWYVGPLSSSPLAARLNNAKITSTVWSYGVGSSQCGSGSLWSTNTLIGVSQVGNTITIVSFTRAGVDSNIPFDQVTYTLGP